MNPLVCFSNEGLNLGTLSNQSILNFNNFMVQGLHSYPPFTCQKRQVCSCCVLISTGVSLNKIYCIGKGPWEREREREREDWRPLTWKRVMALDYVLNGHDCSKDILIIPCWDIEHKSIIIWVFYSIVTHHFLLLILPK